MEKVTIGIDPDKIENGFAVYNKGNGALFLCQCDLYDTFNKLLWYNLRYEVKVRLEAGHTVRQYWQRRTVGTAKSVGENNNVGYQLERFLIKNKIKHQLVKPCGLSSYTHEMFCKITNWDIKKLTNPEKRVAGLLAYKH
jgi:hypothetical protein